MKIELDVDDLKEYFFDEDYGDDYDCVTVTARDVKEKFIEQAIETFAEQFVENNYDYRGAIANSIYEVVKNNKDYIINEIISRVSAEILRKKDIVDNMPKKSEVANISKEWENYFIELIDKAIAKRFK